MKLIPLNIEDKTHPHRHYCMSFENSIIHHKDPTIDKGISLDYVEIFHENKKIEYDTKKDFLKVGLYDQIYGENYYNIEYNEFIDDDVYLLYDAAGLNYIHFFFDLFGKVIFYDEILKQNPNIKLGIPEDFYKDTGNSSFIKQWLNLYYDGDNKNIIILKKNIKYKITNLILPGLLYGFPEPYGDNYILSKIIETAGKISSLDVDKKGCYISRQDTKKRDWYHQRDLINENELIEKIKTELDYDVIELMDYDIIGKIKIFKSYKNIIQQSSASNINILFSDNSINNIILSNPRMGPWLNFKLNQFALKSQTKLIILDEIGEYISNELNPNQTDKDNYPWKLNDIEGIIDFLKIIDNNPNNIWDY